MTFHIITIFPEIFDSYFNESIIKRAKEAEKIDIKIYNLRDFAEDKHRTVDDEPYGGGPGMVLKPEPIWKCVEHIKKEVAGETTNILTVLTSAKGENYNQKQTENISKYSDVIIICGRYEGVDERIAEHVADKEFSIGEYVLTGGELPAMVIVDSVSRLVPGVLGNEESLEDSSWISDSTEDEFFKKNCPAYTRPENFNGWNVPDVLLSGNHGEIEKWRKNFK